MELLCLGTGSAFTELNYNTNFIIMHNDKKLLVDCGTDFKFSLREAKISYKDIDAITISHLHDDHCGGLQMLFFKTYFDPSCKRPILFGEQYLLQRLWDKVLSGGMECLEGIDARLDTYADVQPVNKNSFFTWQGVDFNLVQSLHIVSKYSIMDSFGLMFTAPESRRRIFIPTDVMFAPETSLKAYYKEADLILHDCETAPYKSGVHAHYNDLKTLPAETKAKMYLVHYQDNVIENWDEWKEKAFKDGFLGFLQKGQVIPL
jgi:ribonuclease BN (tRNA processing enzyme)